MKKVTGLVLVAVITFILLLVVNKGMRSVVAPVATRGFARPPIAKRRKISAPDFAPADMDYTYTFTGGMGIYG